MSLLSFDDAKVRRFSQTCNIFNAFSLKKCLSFDINQAVVCEHSVIVCENTLFLHFLSPTRTYMYIKKGCDCSHPCSFLWWVLMDSNHRSRKTADLQSAPFGHSGKHPFSKPGAKVQQFFDLCKFSARKNHQSPTFSNFTPQENQSYVDFGGEPPPS